MSKTATPHLPFLADPSSAPRLPKTESSQIYDSSRQRPRQSDSVRLNGSGPSPSERHLALRNSHRTAIILFAVAVIIAIVAAFTTLEWADTRTANNETPPGTTGLAKPH